MSPGGPGPRRRRRAGPANGGVADRLAVSPETITPHVGSVRAELGARDRTQAVTAAYESGFVRPRWAGSWFSPDARGRSIPPAAPGRGRAGTGRLPSTRRLPPGRYPWVECDDPHPLRKEPVNACQSGPDQRSGGAWPS
ncbi:LuxR C-terminal-related transcriptional regulator [Saccharothrix sp. ST-888]|uniref:LuxR C-terminal-related transcriptional regulator n=1 Tax=Saccharothrix sp. ST-888 TaxID=1427391 RepID=UPI0012E04321